MKARDTTKAASIVVVVRRRLLFGTYSLTHTTNIALNIEIDRGEEREREEKVNSSRSSSNS